PGQVTERRAIHDSSESRLEIVFDLTTNSDTERNTSMALKSSKMQGVVLVVAGALLGYVAASTDLLQRVIASTRSARSAAENKDAGTASEQKSCCGDNLNKGQLLALADSKNETTRSQAGSKKPNIVFIMGDDVGWFQIGAYHRGIMSGKTPNLDKLASQGMLFTDYYAEASCTAGRANFITGEIPLRTGLTTVGQAGGAAGSPAKACTLAA